MATWRGRRALAGEAALACLCAAVGLLIRLPLLQLVPRFTDETGEVQTALRIAFEGLRPLVENDAYRGPWWSYALAAVLALTGPHPAIPRLFACVLGALTVGATYLLARTLAGQVEDVRANASRKTQAIAPPPSPSALQDVRSPADSPVIPTATASTATASTARFVTTARLAGLLAAGLMATSFSHVALNSHVAWANNSTPLWTTLAVWLTVLACAPERQAEGRRTADLLLCAAAVLWGLALHTHPSVLPLLAGTAIWFVVDKARRSRLRTRGVWLAIALFALTMSPLIVYNLQTLRAGHGLATVAEATDASQPVARDLRPAAVLGNLVGLAGQLGRMSGAGPLREAGDPTPSGWVALTDAWRPGMTFLFAAVLLAALAVALCFGPRLPAVLAWSAILCLPFLNRSYENFYDTRYLGYLLPLAYTVLAIALVRIWQVRADAGDDRKPLDLIQRQAGLEQPLVAPNWGTLGLRGRPVDVAVAVCLAVLLFYPLVTLYAYDARELAAARTNAPIWAAAGLVAREIDAAGGQVWVDKGMRPLKLGGGGDPARAFQMLFTLSRTPSQLADADKMRYYLAQKSGDPVWIVAADETSSLLGSEFILETVAEGPGWRAAVQR